MNLISKKINLSFEYHSESNISTIYSDLPIKNVSHEVIPTSWFFRLGMKYPTVLICLLSLFSACTDRNSPVEGHLSKKFAMTSLGSSDIKLENSEVSTISGKENFIDFFKDGTYVMYLNQFEYGDYTLVNDSIYLSGSDGKEWVITYKELDDLLHLKFPNAETVTSLTKISNRFRGDYPFTKERNIWRQRLDRPLTNNEMIDKFQSYCKFMIAYMRWTKKNEMNLSVKHFSGPLKFANNGLMMRRKRETGAWCDYFYQGDCERMDDILRNHFNGLILDWKYTHDRIAMLSNGLEQVIDGMDNYRENFGQESR